MPESETASANGSSVLCVSRHHSGYVWTDNGTDRCDDCWSDAQADQESQR